MHVTVSKNIVDIYPNLRVFSFTVDQDPTKCHSILDDENILNYPEHISTIGIISEWRDIYRSMGIKPTKYYSSIEALLKRYAKGNWKTGNQFVDLYNQFSIKFMAPMGAYDLDKLSELNLRFARSNDEYRPLNSTSKFEINESKIVYAESNKIACWAINHRDSEDFCVTEQTSKILVVAEGFTKDQAIFAEQAITAFHSYYTSHEYRISDIFQHITT